MPSFELKQTDELKTWLIKELEPICDADPEVLSDYVLALLRHDASDGDLQNLLKEQLDDFLAEKTSGFVSKTMSALKSQSYLPASMRSSASAQPSGSREEPLSRKRSADDEGRRSPAKVHREVDRSEGPPRGPSGGRSDGRYEQHDRPQEGRRDGRPKPACRDFHQRGFCPRGDECRYDHTIPGADFGMNPMMNMQMGHPQFAMQGLPPQHNNAYMGVQGQGGFPMGMPGAGGWQGNGNGPPMMPPQGSSESGVGPLNGGEGGAELGARLGAQQPADGAGMVNPSFDGGFRGGGRGGRGGGLARGGGRGMFEKRPTSNTTLVIENVPVENLDLVKINDYFKKFGTITNIQIDVDGRKALVSYSQPAEAKAAHTSPEVIFNNRFVKVYFQKLDDPGIGAKPREAPAKQHAPPLKSNFIPGQTSNKFVRPDMGQSKAKEVQEAAQKKLDVLMAEQKEIMTKLTTGATVAEEKKKLMARFGELEKEIKSATEEVRTAVSAASVAAQAKSASPAPASSAEGGWKEQRESKEREQLDRELEAHSKSGSGSTTDELKAHLAKLQAEAAQLGIDADAATSTRGGFRGGRGGQRGGFRGAPASRGFSSFRGRGGAANRASMSIDNRPTKLHISEVPDREKNQDKVQEHFKQFGDVLSVDQRDDGSFVVHYKTRLSGERALRGGLAVPDVGEVKAAWLTESDGKAEGSGGGSSGDTSLPAEGAEEGGDEEEGDRDDHFRR